MEEDKLVNLELSPRLLKSPMELAKGVRRGNKFLFPGQEQAAFNLPVFHNVQGILQLLPKILSIWDKDFYMLII